MSHLSQWMLSHRLKFNPDKTKFLWLGTTGQLAKLHDSRPELFTCLQGFTWSGAGVSTRTVNPGIKWHTSNAFEISTSWWPHCPSCKPVEIWSTIACLRRTTYMELITSATQGLSLSLNVFKRKLKTHFLSMSIACNCTRWACMHWQRCHIIIIIIIIIIIKTRVALQNFALYLSNWKRVHPSVVDI